MQNGLCAEELTVGGNGDEFSLTAPQAAIWLDWIKGGKGAEYNICNVVQLDGEIDVATLHRAIAQTDQENDALRLRLTQREGDILQYFAPSCLPTDFGVIDLRFADDPEATALAEAEAVHTRPLDPENGVHCRHRLLQLDDRHFWWVRVYHHLVCDGYSGHLMADRVAEIYRALQSGSSIPDSPFRSYRDFIIADARYRESASYARDLAYWQDRLANDQPVTRFTPSTGQQTPAPKQFVQSLNAAELTQVDTVAKHCGTSPTAVMIAAFSLLLAQVTGKKHPALTLPMLNRIGRNERATPGEFACTIPFDIDLNKHDCFSKLAKDIFARTRRDVRHIRFSPVRMRTERLGGQSLGSSGAFFNSLDSLTPLDFGDLTARRMNISIGPVDDLGLIYMIQALTPTQQEAELIWYYNANRIKADAVRQIASDFHHILQGIIANPDQEIAKIAVLPAETLDDPDGINPPPSADRADADKHRAEKLPTRPGTDLRNLTRAVHDIWAKLIETDDFPTNANLFEIGAHSLLVPRAQYALSKLVGREISSLEIFEHPTIEAFVHHVGSESIANSRPETSEAVANDGSGFVFLFPGQGSQQPGMARALYHSDRLSAELIDEACATVARLSGPADLRQLLLADTKDDTNSARLAETAYTQPALFIFEYALARYLIGNEIRPSFLAGHSIGEYVAACLAGVMTFQDALQLVVIRGRLMGTTAPGAMYALSMTEADTTKLLADHGDDLSIAAINGPRQCVVAGPVESIERLDAHLAKDGKPGRRLTVSHAFHSAMMEPVLKSFREVVTNITLSPPQIPVQSNLTGRWLSDADATSPDYWTAHLRNAVRFADNITGLRNAAPDGVMIECGPGNTASRLAMVNGIKAADCFALQPAPASDSEGNRQALQSALSRIRARGADPVSVAVTAESPVEHDTDIPCTTGISRPDKPAAAGAVVARFPAHPLIEGQWLARRDLPPSDNYHIVSTIRLPEATSFEAAKNALERVIARQDTLRSTFVEENGILIQQVHDRMDIPVRRIDRIEDMYDGLFDLSVGPLARFGYMPQDGNRPPLLAFAVDHLCFDGLSVGLLDKEITAELAGKAIKPPCRAETLAERAREKLDGPHRGKAEEFWQQRSDVLLKPGLPHDPMAHGSDQGKRVFHALTPEQGAALETLAQHARKATQTALWSALAVAVIARHREDGSAVLGLPFSGRADHDSLHAMGCFANVLPLTITPDMTRGLDDLLQKTGHEILSVLDVQDYPLSRLIQTLSRQAKRPVGLPFDAVSIIESNEDIHDLDDVDFGAGKFPLMFVLVKCGSGTHLGIEYQTAFYSTDWANRFVKRFLTFICALAKDPTQPIGKVDLLPEDEKRWLTTELNATQSDYPRDCGLGELLCQQIENPEQADRIALDDGYNKITYRELGCRLTTISTKLGAAGIKPGDVVGLAAERDINSILALLGLVWHGAVYLPIDKSLPADAIAELMNECGAKTLLCDAQEKTRLSALEDKCQMALLPAGLDDADPVKGGKPTRRSGEDLAYIMFTSGSTGKPKGVMIPNRAVARLVINNVSLPFDDKDVIAQAAPLGFDAATLEIWAALLNGGRLYLVDNETLFDPAALKKALSTGGVRSMWLTASLFNRLADDAPDTFAPLSRLMSGGEALSPIHLQKVRTACPNVQLINGYGPTENTTFTCTHTVTDQDIASGIIPIGRPVGNSRVYVLDARGEVAPVDVWGELYAAGDGLARGYTGAPERTEKSFVTVNGNAENRLYRTGDRVRWRANGTIEFGGRRDSQVKIRGHRIELAAVEQKLLDITDIRDACVLPVGSGADAFLGAAVAANADRHDQWVAALSSSLPDYMIPERFGVVDHLPVNANGKVDRKKLLALLENADARKVPETATGGTKEAEAIVLSIFEQLFPGKSVSTSSDFFALGGHSLIAMRLAGLLEKETGFRPKLQDIFSTRTVAGLAALIDGVPGDRESNLLPKARGERFALSSGQARLWVLQRMQPELAVYSVPATLRIDGTIDADALQRALHALEDRQHALRLRFRSDPDHPDGVTQYLAPAGSWKLGRHQMDEESATDFVTAEAQRPFDLNDAPMARAELITLAPDRHWLMISLHHAICDGWSMPILLRELAILYAAETGETVPDLPAIERHYEDFASWQNAHLKSAEGRAALTRWQERLSPLPEPLDMPTDHPRPAERRFAGDFLDFAFDDATSRLIEDAAGRYGTTSFSIMTALIQVLLYRHSGQTDIPMGMLVAGREHSELDNVIGFFVNTVLIRQKIDPDTSFDAHLQRTTKTVIEALSDQSVPFEAVVNAVNAPRDPSRNPLFDVLVSWQDELPKAARLGDAEVSLLGTEFPFAKFDLGFYFWRQDAELCGQIEFDTDLYDRETISAFAERLGLLCRAALGDRAGDPLSRLPVLPDQERDLIARFNATARDLAIERCISEPFLDRVAASPTAPAICDETEALSYGQFARRASGIAAKLRARSIRPGDVVAVAVRRSVDMLAAIHGILLAGAAYSPLDPDHPPQRRKDMLDDLGDGLVITTPDLVDLFDAGKTVVIDGSEDADLPGPGDLAGTADDLAYVLFTSGSTGRPKGVEIAHRGVLNRVLWMQDAFPIGPGDVILQKTPITFDVSVWELFWWSWTGAQVVLPPPGAERDPKQIADAISRHKVTTIHFVPSMLSTFLFAIESGMVEIDRLASLKRVFSSGEALDVAVVERFNALLFEKFGTELHNLYGPTEATVDVTWQACSPHRTGPVVPIGKPIANTTVQVVNDDLHPVPIGVAGEIVLGGPQVALGYRNRPELSAEKFPGDPQNPGHRLYRTGDLGRWRRDGTIEYMGRIDHQVKIRGFRIECGEVEVALESHPSVERAPVKAVRVAGLDELHAFVLATDEVSVASLREHLRSRLPEYMIPARFFAIDHLPLTSSGKVDRKALAGKPLPSSSAQKPRQSAPQSEPSPGTPSVTASLEAELAGLWADILPDVTPDREDGFFEIGGNSLLLLRLFEKIDARWPGKLAVTDLFANPSIARQAELLARQDAEPASGGFALQTAPHLADDEPIAIIGMALQVAGADDLQTFWRDVAAGRDQVRPIPPAREADAREFLRAIGRDEPERFRELAYLDHVFEFDAQRFRMAPVDSGLLDPEQRLFIETTLMAIEDAGYGGDALRGQKVGVFAGGGANPVWRVAMEHVPADKVEQAFALNVPSNIVTRLSFLKDWHGPAQVIDTACSSSLVAVHHACQNLRDGTCKVAIAGGAKLLPCPPDADSGFMIDSSTARTRAFDSSADGTGMGEGSVVFVLKPLSSAMRDGDHIHAVIRGSAVNQDGASSGAAAPNPVMQAEVIRDAFRAGDIDPATVSYFEAHGTGTSLGDPIEIAGLIRAFADSEKRTEKAFIGSGKGNYGHLDGTAGALGLARAIMALNHDQAPPQPFFKTPNPKIDFARAPVRVPTQLEKLPDFGPTRRAGVSSFGLSGINVHVVIETAPPRPAPQEHKPDNSNLFVIALSAGSAEALRIYARKLLERLESTPAMALCDIAFTLATGRDALKYRFAVAVGDRGELVQHLSQLASGVHRAHRSSGSASTKTASMMTSSAAEARISIADYLDGAKPVWPDQVRAARLSLPPAPFVRKPCKPVLENRAASPLASLSASGSFLQGPVETANARNFSVHVDDPGFWPAQEHKINDRPTLVGMAVPALIAKALRQAGLASGSVEISGMVWHHSLTATALSDGKVTLSLFDDGRAELGGRTRNGQWRVFSSATWRVPKDTPEVTTAVLETIRHSATIPVESEPFTGHFGPIRISPRWDCNISSHHNPEETRAIKHLRLKPEYHGDLDNWPFHPALADVASSMALGAFGEGMMPVGVDRVTVYDRRTTEVYACGELHASGRVDVTIYDLASQKPVLALSGIRFGKPGEQGNPNKPELLKTVWDHRPVPASAMPDNCLFISNGDFWPVPENCRSVHPDALDRAMLAGTTHAVLALDTGPDSARHTADALRIILRNLGGRLRLVVLGHGAYRTDGDVSDIDPDQSAAAGVVIAVAHEDSKLHVSYVDMAAAELQDHLGAELASPKSRDPVVLYRNGQRLVRRLTPLAPEDRATGAPVWPGHGVCVVSGGTGGFALALAEEMSAGGKLHLALLARHGENGLDHSAKERLAALRDKGVGLSIFVCDVADTASLAAVLDRIRIELGPVTAIAHAAGIADNGFLALRDMTGFDNVLSAKIIGARNLDRLTRDDPVEAFVMFGSVTAIVGAPGQAAYCAANGFLGGFARYRRAQGRVALTIDWCTLADQGMAARNNVVLSDGFWISPDQAPLYWRDALASSAPQITLLDPALLEEQGDTPPRSEQPAPAVTAKPRQPDPVANIAAIWAETLGYDAVDAGDDFFALGGDSITGMQIIDRMNTELGTTLAISDLFSAPTVSALSELAGIGPETGDAQPTAPANTDPRSAIAAIWAETLGYEAIDPQEDFYALGGDSITGMQIIDRLTNELGLEVSLSDLFEYPTVEKIGSKLLSARPDTADRPVPNEKGPQNDPATFPSTEVSLPPETGNDPRKAPDLPRYPLAPEQVSVMNAAQKGNMGTAFNLPHAFLLDDNIDLDRLRQSIMSLTGRHEILRSRIISNGDDWHMEICPAEQAVPDLSLIKVDQPVEEACRALVTPFDLAREFPARWKLLRDKAGKTALFFDIHHVQADGFTTERLFGDLFALYHGAELAPLRYQLRDYAWWSQSDANRERLASARDYWQSMYQGALPMLDLPSDRRRPAYHTFNGGITGFELDPDLLGAARKFAANQRVTMFTLVLSAWFAVLSRLAETDDLVISVPVDSRDATGFRDVPGMMVSLLPLRMQIRPGDTVSDLLRRMQDHHVNAMRHRAYFLDQLLDDLAPPASPDRTLLSEVSLSYMNYDATSSDATQDSSLPVPLGLDRLHCKNDVGIFVRDLPERMTISFDYYADMFDRSRMDELGAVFAATLDRMIRAADQTVGSINLVPEHQAQLIRTWENGPTTDIPENTGLFSLFAKMASENPDRCAVQDASGCWTYGELATRATDIARHLIEADVKQGDLVAMHMARGRDAVAAVLGITAAGAGYVPLDPAYPADRNRFILTDSQARVILADSAGMDALSDVGNHHAQIISTTDIRPGATISLTDVASSAPAYLMYTSGSTGTPKGVLIEQGAVLRLALAADFAALAPDDIVAQAGPLAFDASTFEIWATLLRGAGIAVIDHNTLLDPAAFGDALGRFAVNKMFMSAGLFNRQVDHDPSSMAGLEVLLIGGDTISKHHARKFREANPHTRLCNAYGPTESTTFAVIGDIHDADLDDRNDATIIGRPIAHTRTLIRDANGLRVPVGVWGELHIGGGRLAREYWRQPDLTANRFVPDPDIAGERLYRTGDFARWTTDGRIEFGGRRDNQIKLRGFRIELDEIEQQLRHAPSVKNAVVLFNHDGTNGGEIVACVVTEPEGEATVATDGTTIAALQTWLGQRLPGYMVPGRWYLRNSIPVTANGKVDRKALLKQLQQETPAAAHSSAADTEPLTGSEETVASIFSEVFGTDIRDRNASFAVLGGHSLMAIRIVNRIADRTGKRISMADFFACSTIAAIAAHLDTLDLPSDGHLETTIPPAPEMDVYPASHAQKRLYLLSKMAGNSGAYGMQFVLRCSGDLRADLLRTALEKLVERHETLRTAFEEHDGIITQHIHQVTAPAVTVDDVSDSDDPVRAALRLTREEASTPIALDQPPLIRARLIRAGTDEYLLVITTHHIVGDGWSSRILVSELGALYEAARDNHAPQLSALPITYKDFAYWQSLQDWPEAAEYWREQLKSAPDHIALPTDRPAPELQSYRGSHEHLAIPPETLRGLHDLARTRKTTLSAVGMALFAAMLYRLTRQNDMVIGMGIAGRDRAETEGLIGFFVNVLPIRVQLDDQTELDALISNIHQNITAAMDRQDYPFDELVRAVAPKRHSNRQPLVNVVFEYQRFEALSRMDDVSGLPLMPANEQGVLPTNMDAFVDNTTAKHDVILFLTEEADQARFTLEYDTDLFDAQTMQRWLAFLGKFANAAVQNIQRTNK